jgi:hypothetical protein
MSATETQKNSKKKESEPLLLNLCGNAIYHLRKLASMESDPEKMKHHLKVAREYFDKIQKHMEEK